MQRYPFQEDRVPTMDFSGTAAQPGGNPSRGLVRNPLGAARNQIERWCLKARENVERSGWGGDRTDPGSSSLT